MTYYLNSRDGYIISISTNSGATEITKEEYENILALIKNKPMCEEGYEYMLKTDLTWELVKIEEEA